MTVFMDTVSAKNVFADREQIVAAVHAHHHEGLEHQQPHDECRDVLDHEIDPVGQPEGVLVLE